MIREFNIKLPVSAESFGRWLEDNNARVEVACMLGNYHVSVTLHRPEGYKEQDGVSVSKSRRIEVSSHSKSFDVALSEAMKTAEGVRKDESEKR